MCINPRDHVDLGVAGIALGGLQVAVIQLELVGSAEMPQRVENYVRQFSILFELVELLLDHSLINWTTIVLREDQIEVLILICQELNDLSFL